MKQCAVVINRQKDPQLKTSIRYLERLVLNECKIRIDRTLSEELPAAIRACANVEFVEENDLYLPADFLFVFGGDGTVIKASARLGGNGTSIVGVNLGRVGYLAQFDPEDAADLDLLFSGAYHTEDRIMLSCVITRPDGVTEVTPDALNDAVISNGALSQMVDVLVRCDGVPVQYCHGDGLIVATPTGSTAYSMSAGGPVIAPTMDCFCITPVCSHTLSSRPVVVPASGEVTLEIQCREGRHAYLTVDGAHSFELSCGDRVTVTRSERFTRFARTRTDGFYEALQKKIIY